MKNTPYQQAVALEYGKNKTPIVSAKGEGELALRIIAEAKRKVFMCRKTLGCSLC